MGELMAEELHIPDPEEGHVLRHVTLGDTEYRLLTWDTGKRCTTGQHQIGYAFWHPDGRLLFSGDECGVAPSHCIDSDDALRGLLGFLTIQPGDTDDDYFESYTPEQLTWAETEAESLQEWGMESDEDFEAPEFEDIES